MEKIIENGYTVSAEAGAFIEAMKSLEKTEEAYLNALRGLWGENTGTQIFDEHNDEFIKLRRTIMAGLESAIMDFLSERTIDKLQAEIAKESQQN